MGLLFKKKKEKQAFLLKWQNIIMDDLPDKLIMTEQQLKQASEQRATNDLRIINDCIKITSETTKPDTFFSRLELLKEKAADLIKLEPYVNFSGASPSDGYNEIVEKEQDAIYQFIGRYFSYTLDEAEKLKTEKGKRNSFQKFHDSLMPYTEKMNQHNINYINYKCRDRL